jgi:prepilin-type N-terminal cleavage/methylation domain-containing protein
MHRDKAFTLIELSLVVVLSLILASAAVPNFVRSVHVEAARTTALEMSQLAEALRGYYIREHAWPQGMEELRASGLLDDAWSGQDPFGHAYIIHPDGANCEVTATVIETMAPVTASLLPMASVQGADVIVSVTPPGAAMNAVPAGTIIPWPSEAIPPGWFVCDGRAVSRAQQAGLFAVIGTMYGAGDGATTFNVPDLRGRTVMGLDDMGSGAANVISDARARILGSMLGEERHQLTVAEMPSHSHAYYATFLSGRYDGHSSLVATSPQWSNTNPAGGDMPHNNLQPSMALYWIIRG